MRNQRRVLRTLGASAALAAALMAINVTQAAAIPKWSPGNVTATGAGTGLSVYTAGQIAGYHCNSTSMTMRTAPDGSYALTQPSGSGVTFSSCSASGFAAGQSVAMTMSGQWKITPTSTSTALVEIPVNGFRVLAGPGGAYCTINVGPTVVDATWSSALKQLKLSDTSVAQTSSGYGFCAGVQPVSVGMGNGWNFPAFTIIP